MSDVVLQGSRVGARCPNVGRKVARACPVRHEMILNTAVYVQHNARTTPYMYAALACEESLYIVTYPSLLHSITTSVVSVRDAL